MLTFDNYIDFLERENRAKIEALRHHYEAGKRDCQQGIYDKWYRYYTLHDGRAYDLGWQDQNKTTQNERVQFIEVQ